MEIAISSLVMVFFLAIIGFFLYREGKETGYWNGKREIWNKVTNIIKTDSILSITFPNHEIKIVKNYKIIEIPPNEDQLQIPYEMKIHVPEESTKVKSKKKEPAELILVRKKDYMVKLSIKMDKDLIPKSLHNKELDVKVSGLII